jgi:hypothetical protein
MEPNLRRPPNDGLTLGFLFFGGMTLAGIVLGLIGFACAEALQ